jgi:protoporphyrinogen oxidase
MTADPHVVILGGGPAGCGAAYQIRRLGRGRATLIERQSVVGGNAGSFEWAGQHLDFGSHRLHHSCDPRVLGDIRQLLGDDLADRPRNGRIRLRGRWLRFPLKPVDLVRRLDPGFAFGFARDTALRPIRKLSKNGNGAGRGETFASVLLDGLGPTMCEHFYFPYARKLWGHEPETLSAIQARRRVSAASASALLRKLVRPTGKGFFYYPRKGFGQITQGFAEAARGAGADLMLGWGVTSVAREGSRWIVTAEQNEKGAVKTKTLEADYVWSTIPVTLLARMMRPAPPPNVIADSHAIDYRAMVLVYLQLDVDQFTPTDAHYFPELDVLMSRLSEPKNYFGLPEPKGTTVLCAELPCAFEDSTWSMSDEDLGRRVADDMERVGLKLARRPIAVHVRRLRQAYPIYNTGYERALTSVDSWIAHQPNLLVYGRQGLFAHDNTHHALYMAYAAVDCLREHGFDAAMWENYRRIFETHVVED